MALQPFDDLDEITRRIVEHGVPRARRWSTEFLDAPRKLHVRSTQRRYGSVEVRDSESEHRPAFLRIPRWLKAPLPDHNKGAVSVEDVVISAAADTPKSQNVFVEPGCCLQLRRLGPDRQNRNLIRRSVSRWLMRFVRVPRTRVLSHVISVGSEAGESCRSPEGQRHSIPPVRGPSSASFDRSLVHARSPLTMGIT